MTWDTILPDAPDALVPATLIDITGRLVAEARFKSRGDAWSN
jgi:hypothetical protein